MILSARVHRWAGSVLAVAMVVLAAGRVRGQVVGEVVWSADRTEVRRQGEPPRAAKDAIHIGDSFSTDTSGLARLLFYDDVVAKAEGRLPVLLHHLNLGGDSDAAVVAYDVTGPTGPRARFALKYGTAYALFANQENAQYEIATPTAIAVATGTAFVISCNASSTDVITLSGTVLVRSLVMREKDQVTVKAGEMTSVAAGAKSLRVIPASLDRLHEATAGLELIGGGRGESLAVADGVQSGRDVLPAERSKFVLPRHPVLLDPCPFPSAPTCVPPEPPGGLGNLDIEF